MEDIDAYPIPGFREPVNCFTHPLAVLVVAVLSAYLVRRSRGDWHRTASLVAMASATLFLLSMSGVYHLLGLGAGHSVMRQLDIAGVFALSLNWPVLIPYVVGPHEVWHLAVLTGLGLHWKFVIQFAHGPPDIDVRNDCVARISTSGS